MPRKPPITEEQVFDAANTLSSQGKEVTPTALLGQLGSGSYSTIYKHLASWESKRANTLTTQPAGEAPELVKSAFATVWRVVTAEAAKEVTAIREKAAEEVRAAEKKLSEALETIEKLERESEADTVQIEQLTDELANTEKDLHKAQADNAALQATIDELNKRIHAQETEQERMHKDLDDERKRNQHEREQAAAAQQKSMSQIENLQKDLAAMKSEFEKSKHEADLRATMALEQAQKATEHANKKETELETLRKERDAALKDSAIFAGQVESLKSQNSELITRLDKGKS